MKFFLKIQVESQKFKAKTMLKKNPELEEDILLQVIKKQKKTFKKSLML